MKQLSWKYVGRTVGLAMLLSLVGMVKAQDAQEPSRRIFDPFDRWFGTISAEEERFHLDNFAIALQQNPDWIGYILVYAGKTSCKGEAQRHANRLKRYVVEFRKISWDRVIAKDRGYFDKSMVILQPLTREMSKEYFSYQSRSKEHVVRRCRGSKQRKIRRS